MLAPSTSVVLHMNLFACVYVNALLFSLWRLIGEMRKETWFYFVFGLDKVFELYAYVSLMCNKEIRVHVVLLKKGKVCFD